MWSPRTDSRARPYCDSKIAKAWISPSDISRRLEEAKATFERIRNFAWIDADNIFLVGHSMGGMTVSNYAEPDFRGYVILGIDCTSFSSASLAGVKVPKDKPVLAIRGDADEWIRDRQGTCGSYLHHHTNARSIMLPGAPHDTSVDPTMMPTVVAFLKQNTTHPVKAQR